MSDLDTALNALRTAQDVIERMARHHRWRIAFEDDDAILSGLLTIAEAEDELSDLASRERKP